MSIGTQLLQSPQGLCKLPIRGTRQRRIGRRICFIRIRLLTVYDKDILGVPFDELGAALIYFTGARDDDGILASAQFL